MRTPYDPASALPGPSAFDPGRRGVRALACLAGVVVLAAAFFAWRSGARPEPAPDPLPGNVSAPPTQLVVAVAGLVLRPGLVRLPPGARVADAIEAAGGVLPGVDLTTVNLARKVADGELIAIGPPAAAGTVDGKVSLNTATLAQLDSLPGVGPVLAQRIVDYRVKHGGFRDVGELRKVAGIGEETFGKLKDLVTL